MAELETSLKDLASMDWVKEYVKQEIKKAIESGPIIVDPPIPAPKKCDEGPEIKKVSIVSKRRFEVGYHGKNVTLVYAILTDKNDRVIPILKVDDKELNKLGQFTPINNHPAFEVGEDLNNDAYTIKFTAINCTGESSYCFNGVNGAAVSPCKETGTITDIALTKI